jgi:hypothetical protein
MFCLVAYVETRRATENRKGLQDALRAIVDAGATINTESALPPILTAKRPGTDLIMLFTPLWGKTPFAHEPLCIDELSMHRMTLKLRDCMNGGVDEGYSNR